MDRLLATMSEDVGLIVRAISFQDFQPMWSQITNVADRRTDGQTDGRHAIPRPRICTKVHCAVIKIRFEVQIFQVSQHRFAFGNFRRCDVTSRVKARFSLSNMFVLVKKSDFHCVRHYCLMANSFTMTLMLTYWTWLSGSDVTVFGCVRLICIHATY